MKKFSSITLALLAFIMLVACSPKAQGTTDLETPHRYTNPTGKEFPIMVFAFGRTGNHRAIPRDGSGGIQYLLLTL